MKEFYLSEEESQATHNLVEQVDGMRNEVGMLQRDIYALDEHNMGTLEQIGSAVGGFLKNLLPGSEPSSVNAELDGAIGTLIENAHELQTRLDTLAEIEGASQKNIDSNKKTVDKLIENLNTLKANSRGTVDRDAVSLSEDWLDALDHNLERHADHYRNEDKAIKREEFLARKDVQEALHRLDETTPAVAVFSDRPSSPGGSLEPETFAAKASDVLKEFEGHPKHEKTLEHEGRGETRLVITIEDHDKPLLDKQGGTITQDNRNALVEQFEKIHTDVCREMLQKQAALTLKAHGIDDVPKPETTHDQHASAVVAAALTAASIPTPSQGQGTIDTMPQSLTGKRAEGALGKFTKTLIEAAGKSPPSPDEKNFMDKLKEEGAKKDRENPDSSRGGRG